MKLKLLVAALAAAFSASAFAEGDSTSAPSATAPQGNPPYTAPAGSQADPSTALGTATAKDRTHVRKDRQARKDRKHDSATGATTTDKENDHSKSDATSGSTAAPVTSGASAPVTGSASAPASSPSSGGPASDSGTPKGGAGGVTTPKEPK